MSSLSSLFPRRKITMLNSINTNESFKKFHCRESRDARARHLSVLTAACHHAMPGRYFGNHRVIRADWGETTNYDGCEGKVCEAPRHDPSPDRGRRERERSGGRPIIWDETVNQCLFRRRRARANIFTNLGRRRFQEGGPAVAKLRPLLTPWFSFKLTSLPFLGMGWDGE